MTPDGTFRSPPPPAPWVARLTRAAIIVAAMAGTLAVAALALWFAILLIPIALGAALIAYLGFRFQMWRAGKSFASRADIYRP